jgi:hypothetical protein
LRLKVTTQQHKYDFGMFSLQVARMRTKCWEERFDLRGRKWLRAV